MAAAKGNKNASGKHRAVDINDKQLAAYVRSLALTEIKEILEGDGDKMFKQALLLRLAGSILPRLNEHSGEGGGPIEQRIIYLPTRDGRMETTSRQTN